MPGMLTHSNAWGCRVIGILTIIAAITSISSWGILASIALAIGGISMWRLGGDPHNHGAIRRISAGLTWTVFVFIGTGLGLA
jgi:hypothetical protein